jgi:hypothetical protein
MLESTGPVKCVKGNERANCGDTAPGPLRVNARGVGSA